MKIKLLTTVSIVLLAVGVVTAAEVINVDIKGFGDNTPYIGNGAYDVGNAVWIPYYGGWGVPVGSARTEGLTPPISNLTHQYYSSAYAAQVWIGDPGSSDLVNHHEYWSSGSGGLLNDGFKTGEPNEPNISIWGSGAYTGLYDMYVYGNADGNFILDQNGVKTSKHVTGGVVAGSFVNGGNYVIFTDVNVISADSSKLYLTYTNELAALQLVREKSSFAIEPNALGLIRIPAGDWDVAGDRNTRTTESNRYGPDTYNDDVNGVGRCVGYMDCGEFMDYDINVVDGNQGQYNICLGIMGTTSGLDYINAGTMTMYLDNVRLGDVNHPNPVPAKTMDDTTSVTANLYPGIHTVRWFLGPGGVNDGSTNTGCNLAYVKFTRIGSFTPLEDLAAFVDNWLICDNPDLNGCL